MIPYWTVIFDETLELTLENAPIVHRPHRSTRILGCFPHTVQYVEIGAQLAMVPPPTVRSAVVLSSVSMLIQKRRPRPAVF